MLESLVFATPWALAGFAALPVIWWLLRFVPPRPQEVAFPPIRILLGLDAPEVTPDKTPWWLLLLRLTLAALLILGVSHPLWSPGRVVGMKSGPLLLVVDDGWAAAHKWQARQDLMQDVLRDAQQSSVPVILATTTPVHVKREFATVSATDAINSVAAFEPRALTADRTGLAKNLATYKGDVPGRIVWLSDGSGDADAMSFANAISTQFPTTEKIMMAPDKSELPVVVSNVRLDGGEIKAKLSTARAKLGEPVVLQARAANGRVLAEQIVTLPNGIAEASITLPIELRNEIQSLVVAGENHAAARFLLDDRWRRKTVAVMSGSSFEIDQPLLSPLHYVSRALEPYADISEPETPQDLKSSLDAGLSMLVLADIGRLPEDQFANVERWVEKGGVLVRFAGPRLAAGQDALVPVPLRDGGRELGSALSWEEPQGLQAISEKSPFAGIPMDTEVKVTRQVLADPDSSLPDKTWVSLADGTPMVTASRKGKGLIVLFHVTANPEWSSLPLSGMFVEMLRRLGDLAPAAGSTMAAAGTAADAAQAFAPRVALSGRGELVTPEASAKPISASVFDKTSAGPDAMPGLYERNGQDRAINLEVTDKDIAAIQSVGSGWTTSSYVPAARVAFAPYLFGFAFLLFLADGIASLIIGGALKPQARGASATALALGLMVLFPIDRAFAEPSEADMRAALTTSLGFIETGDDDVDKVSEEGLNGLGVIISDRTSAVLGPARKINLERDDMVFYPMIYWPITENAQEPTPVVLAKIEKYMKNGGTLFFDLREDGADTDALSGGTSSQAQALQRILAKLDIPSLAPVEENHVLTRTFYLLQDFPGRYTGGKLWVESSDAGDNKDPGAADGVSSIIIGSNDYAAAWALDSSFEPLYAVIPGDDQQREYAFRTGINIVMYALTGNYKADQVHIPALLERLGQ
jgi:Domain of unknown function (DUF4159)/Aerotolerance regulator N-terminal